MHKPSHWLMLGTRLEVLTKREELTTGIRQIGEDVFHFLSGFS